MDLDARLQLNADLRVAYGEMTRRNPSDSPFSMAAQAWLHQYYCCPLPDGAPEILPKQARDTDIHHTWDFLPWHRAFLYFHERAIQAFLPADRRNDFRLPVWDWDASPEGAVTPWVYDRFIWAPPATCTCVGSDMCACVRRKQVSPVTDCLLQAWLQADNFVGSSTDWGMASEGPHSTVHVQLAGQMSDVPKSAIDPLFYAHHANVDRFWELWRKRFGRDPQWAADCVYYYWDALPDPNKPRLVKVTPADLLDTRKLGYEYAEPDISPWDLGKPFVMRAEEMLDFSKDRLSKILGWLGIPKKVTLPALIPPAVRAVFGRFGKPALGKVSFSASDYQPGQYYALEAADLTGNTKVRIGGFGTFTDETGERTFRAPLCLDLEKVVALLQMAASGGFQIACAPPPPATTFETFPVKLKPPELRNVVLSIQLPKFL
jgi:hypothetical protein